MCIDKSALSPDDVVLLANMQYEQGGRDIIGTKLSSNIFRKSNKTLISVNTIASYLLVDLLNSVDDITATETVEALSTILSRLVSAVVSFVVSDDLGPLTSFMQRVPEENDRECTAVMSGLVSRLDELVSSVNDNTEGTAAITSAVMTCLEVTKKIEESLSNLGSQAEEHKEVADDHHRSLMNEVREASERIIERANYISDVHNEAGEVRSHMIDNLTTAVNQLAQTIDTSNRELARRAYSDMCNTIALAKAEFKDLVSQIGNRAVDIAESSAQYQGLIVSTSNAANKLSSAAEVFQDCVFTAERYAATITDVLAIQQLQARVNDMSKVMIEEVTCLSNSWERDRSALYDTMKELSDLIKTHTVYNDVLSSLNTITGMSTAILAWIDKYDKEKGF